MERILPPVLEDPKKPAMNKLNFELLACNIEGDITFQNLHKFFGGKSPYILCKNITSQTQITAKVILVMFFHFLEVIYL